MVNTKLEAFCRDIKRKKIAVCGIGHNNIPVIYQLLRYGAIVTACDRRSREQLGEVAEKLEAAGVTLQLGDGYLDTLEVDIILRTPGMKPYLPPFEEARRKGIPVTSEMELFFDLCPAPIYAVTGSDGKTTTTTIIAGLLEACGRRVFLGGNIGRPLLPLIEEIQPEDAAVVELSSFQLTRMTKSPHVAVVTNVAPNHLDWHTDMAEYIEAKKNLIAYQTGADRAVLNGDNAITTGFADETKAQVWMFSRRTKPVRGAYLGEDGILYAAEPGAAPIAIMPAAEIKLPGVHNIENYLAAISAVWGEAEPATIAAYAQQFGGVPHRCELVRTLHGVRWYNDSIGSSPSRTMAGLEAFDRPVILIAGGYDKHIPYEPLGPVAAKTVKTAILMGDTADAIESSIRACSAMPIIRVADMEEAVLKAKELAQSGDIVFLSPASASFDKYKNFEERGNHFKSIVNALPAD